MTDATALAATAANIQTVIESGDLAVADAALSVLLADARTPSILAMAGYVKSRLGAFADAAGLCGEAERAGLSTWSNAFILGTSLRDLGRWDEARQALEDAHRLAPQRLDAIEVLLQLTIMVDGVEAAHARFTAMADEHPGLDLAAAWPSAVVGAIRAAMDQLRLEEAVAVCQAAVDRGERDTRIPFLFGHILGRLGRHEEAARHSQSAVDLGLEDWSNYLFLGSSLKELGRRAEACAAFANANRLSPASLDAATLYLEEALAVHGLGHAEALYAQIEPQVGQPALRAAWARMAAEAVPDTVPPLIQAGRLDEAIQTCRQYGGRRMALWAGYLRRYQAWDAWRLAERARRGDSRPKISVFLITYKHEKYVAQALDSILAQRCDYDIEINAIDDASPDGTQAVILDYQKRYPGVIHTYFNATNVGTLDPPQQKVTHKGYKTLKGDYFAILEGDDYWSDPLKLQKQISFLEAHPTFAACCHNTTKIYEGGDQAAHKFLYFKSTKRTYTVDDATEMSMFFHTSSIVFRNVLMGQPPPEFASKWSCDIYWSAAHLQHGEMHHIDEEMSVYRAHGGGLYSNLPALKGRLFNIEGLLRYNRWLGWRFAKNYAFALNRLTLALFKDLAAGVLPPLDDKSRRRYARLSWLSGKVYDILDRRPRLDPAAWRYGEPTKPPHPRTERLAPHGLKP